MKGKDFIGALLHHLIINQAQSQSTYLFSHNDDEKLNALIFLPEHAEKGLLTDLLAIYQNGLRHPEAFFTEATFAYFKQSYNSLKEN